MSYAPKPYDIASARMYLRCNNVGGVAPLDETKYNQDMNFPYGGYINNGKFGEYSLPCWGTNGMFVDSTSGHPVIDSSYQFTISGWFYLRSPGAVNANQYQNCLAGITSFNALGVFIGVAQNNCYSLNMYGNIGDGNNHRFVPSSTPVVMNKWVHLCLTHVGGDCRLYLDGNLILQQWIYHDPGVTPYFSTSYVNAGQAFVGVNFDVQELIVWGRGFSAGEIALLYNSYGIKHLYQDGNNIYTLLPTVEGGKDVAMGKPVGYDDYYTTFYGEYANDGNFTTRWATTGVPNVSRYWLVDLGQPYTINRFGFVSTQINTVTISGSNDGVNWVPIANFGVSINILNDLTFGAAVTYRFFKCHNFVTNSNNWPTISVFQAWTVRSAGGNLQYLGTAPATEAMFRDYGINTSDLDLMTNAQMQSFASQQPVLLTYNPVPAMPYTFQLTAVPNTKLITPSGDLNMSSMASINTVNVIGAEPASGRIRLVVSINKGVTWRSWFSNAWNTINLDVPTVGAFGMTIATLSSLTSANWFALTGAPYMMDMRFAYLLNMGASSETLYVDQISINANMNGYWAGANPGVDYNYMYEPSGKVVDVKLLTNGDFKINY